MGRNGTDQRHDESTTKFAVLNSSTCAVWELPRVIVFHMAKFVAAPTTRATVLCHQIAPLCRTSYQAILNDQQSSLFFVGYSAARRLWHFSIVG
jgi:hypothetical protein